MDKITPEMLTTFLIVAAALSAFFLLILNIRDRIQAARKPHEDLVEWQRNVDNKLKTDKEKIDRLENGQSVMLRGINAIISHEINGNSTEKLVKSQEEILNYLTRKGA